ncbi:polyphosphate kinase 1 [Flavobacterium microcysteis]|uniref:Polyphosphate kinase n=1 Tax=Flavobacterium microcysteis TaxID=2596891 RepID=A0A501QCL3_9FLAO|nr:polyphosphate kinase 1 [Flavobacterium microcysteis]TPD69935.1 polyphosphate kinase 1 [Flavobacterium microcysteis]
MILETKNKEVSLKPDFFDRDISWLSFNERVLLEADANDVPLFEKIKFLSIYSSNLDEFYRVRIPSLMALKKISKNKKENSFVYQHILDKIQHIVDDQQRVFGTVMTKKILPGLEKEKFHLIYNEPVPENIHDELTHYFFTEVLTFLQVVEITKETEFFPENNKLYKLVVLEENADTHKLFLLNIPSDDLPRFFSVKKGTKTHIVFLDDIISFGLKFIFKDQKLPADYNFKITRDAAIELDDEYDEAMAEKMEKKIAKRDFSFATRFLFDYRMPPPFLQSVIDTFKLKDATIVLGGRYHNLKDLASLPLKKPNLSYAEMVPIPLDGPADKSLFDTVAEKDLMLHVPYQSYDSVLRFFNEASIHPNAEEIYVTLYRVASDSRIANALISAAKNGKKVTVVVELKARFDEANNIKWSKQLKKAGVRIVHSIPSLKVHAKIALVKFKKQSKLPSIGLLATGNLNENTARFYTDHILMTANKEMLKDLEKTFLLLATIKKNPKKYKMDFKHLLVAKFNLREKFIKLIDNEIQNKRKGLDAGIIIKLNNLEEKSLIEKLYEASNAGVKIQLMIRGICCLVPGIPGRSENISVRRIVDRYLEHGRIFVFENNGSPLLFMGSADWMNRNIYNRIEVCFPIYDPILKEQMLDILNIQLEDNTKASLLGTSLENIPVRNEKEPIRSQDKIYDYLKRKA